MRRKKPQKVEPEQLQKIIKKPGPFKLGAITLPAGIESQVVFISGSTGTGKTQAQAQAQAHVQLLSQYRLAGHKGLIYDPKPEFTGKFFEAGDAIICPADRRSLK